VLCRIAMLYAIEDEVRGASAEQRRSVRDERSRVIVDDLRQYLDARNRQVSAKSKLGEATLYALRNLRQFRELVQTPSSALNWTMGFQKLQPTSPRCAQASKSRHRVYRHSQRRTRHPPSSTPAGLTGYPNP